MAFSIDSRRLAWPFGVVATTAILVWFGTGLNPAWPLMWFAPLPILLYAPSVRWWSSGLAAFAGWFIGYLGFWGYLHGSLGMPIGFVIACVAAFALVFACAVLLYRALLRRGQAWYALFAFPAVWVSFEYLLNLGGQNGTAFNLAYTQLGFLPFLQLASITGPWGMSFLLLLFPAAIGIAVHLRAQRTRTALLVAGGTMGLIAAVLVFGAVRLALPQGSRTATVGLVASDASDNFYMAASGKPAMQLFRAYAQQFSKLASRGAKVIVFPEKVAVATPATQPAMDALFQPLSNRTGATIVVGVKYEAAQARYNEARIYAPGQPARSYIKHHLLRPFESELTPGTQLVSMTTPTSRWGVAICKDMDFTQLSRQYGNLGVGLMLVPGVDFDVDRGFHGHMAIMRGVESGFSIAHSARRGYLTVSDDRGRILGQARSDSAPFATVLVNAPATHSWTLFLAWGDWFAWLAMAIVVSAILRLVWLIVPVVQESERAV